MQMKDVSHIRIFARLPTENKILYMSMQATVAYTEPQT